MSVTNITETYDGIPVRKLQPDADYTHQWVTTSKMRNKAYPKWLLVQKRRKRAIISKRENLIEKT